MLPLLVAASAVIPSILLVWYFRASDENPEPGRVLWWTFFLGVLTVIPVLVYCAPLSPFVKGYADPAVRGTLSALLLAALPEEFFKFLVVTGYAARHKEFDEPMDGIVYGAVASLGFATLENILYVSSGGLGVAVLRALTAVPGHAAMGAIMGYYVARARFGLEDRSSAMAKAYFIPVVLHAVYDAPLLALKEGAAGVHPAVAASPLLSIAVLIFEIVWVRRLVRQLRSEQLAIRARTAAAVAVEQPDAASVAVIAAESAAVEARIASKYGKRPSTAGTLFRLVLGGLLASIGGLFALAIIAAFATGGVAPDNRTNVVAGTLVLAVPPLLFGLLLFRSGLRRLQPGAAPA